jgi:flagellar biosynthesis protein FlhG
MGHLGDTLPPPAPASLDGLVEPGRVRPRRIIAVGGGRGGVGKTLLTVNLGVYFAQLGREVVVVDADPTGSSLHTVLGLERAPLVIDLEREERSLTPVSTSVPGLTVLPSTYDPLTATPTRPTRGANLMRALSRLPVDYVIVNLGASTSAASLDVFLESDIGLCVTAADPLSVEATYRFARSLYLRVLRRAVMKERFKLRIVEKVASSLEPMPSPLELIVGLRRVDDALATIATHALSRVLVRLVVGQTRLRADLDLGPAMAIVSERFLGIQLDHMGHIEQDDAVWLTVRRRQPLLIDSPTSRSARNIERVARRILALLAARDARPVVPGMPIPAPKPAFRPFAPRTLYDTLGVARGAADDEIRRAYKRQHEIFQAGSMPLISVVSATELEREQARIQEAHDTLLDPARRRAYDLSAFPDDAPLSAPPVRARSAAEEAELAMLQAELARQLHADTEYTGALLRKVREARDVSLEEISNKTKIGVQHLAALEAERVQDLPAAVYVQGFVQELAKFLKLEAPQVQKTYMRRYREIAAGRMRSGG